MPTDKTYNLVIHTEFRAYNDEMAKSIVQNAKATGHVVSVVLSGQGDEDETEQHIVQVYRDEDW